MTDIDKMIEAVEAGGPIVAGDGAYGRLYQDAFAGSLDAAKGLHDALLAKAERFAEHLRARLFQDSYTIETPALTYWHTRREA